MNRKSLTFLLLFSDLVDVSLTSGSYFFNSLKVCLDLYVG